MIRSRTAFAGLVVSLVACQARPTALPPESTVVRQGALTVRDTTIRSTLEASGVAAAVRGATLATRLMGSVTEVAVHEGQRVRSGELLVRIDAADVNAQAAQAAAGLAQAEAQHDNARRQADRLRALYADSAAPRAQLDDAEAGLARTDAGVHAAQGAVAEVAAVRAYSEIRAPFDGTIVKRYVDPGAFVSPGMPLIAIEDPSRLRLSVTVAPSEVHGILPGALLRARIDREPATATVEGLVPASGSALYVVNALVENRGGRFLAGTSGTLLLPRSDHVGILLPERVLVREHDMTGAYVRGADGKAELRWLRVTPADEGRVEVLSGLLAGEVVEFTTLVGPAH